ncbi:MAG: HAD-IIB family hydrolase [Methylococcaceae bacterium]|jgi:sucrose-phosphate synthase
MPEPRQTDALYIVMLSIHGLIRGQDPELGRDADTGGQTKYVLELCKALAKQPAVARIDLATRLIIDKEVSPDYAVIYEPLAEKAQIVRIEAGPEAYIRKEELWDYLDSYADNLLNWLHLQPRLPDIIHCHYADAGYVGVRLSHWTGLPLIFTGHSLGRDKFRRLLASGQTKQDIDQRYHMARRIDAEEDTLTNADLVITSTHNEVVDQYELYDCYTPEKMVVLPPGTDLEEFFPPNGNESANEFTKNLEKFLQTPNKPMILALSRPDERKNIVALLEAYGESTRLQELANLVIIAGNRDDIRDMGDGPQGVLTELLLVIDCYDLYGRVALPKHHAAHDVAQIYRLAAASGGVFVNPALTEPFGLTLLEAAASGLPLVATENGGPVDIIGNCQNGLLVDPLDRSAMAAALLDMLEQPLRWQAFSNNGLHNVARYYAWDAHAQSYLAKMQALLKTSTAAVKTPIATKNEHARTRTRALFTDIDHSLLGDNQGLEQFIQALRLHRKKFLFGIATGRRLDSALAVLKKHHIPMPDILITSLGTEIYYAPQLIADITWAHHIDHLWTPQVLKRIIAGIPGLSAQAKSEQSRFKLSYHYHSEIAPPTEDILTQLRQQELPCNLTLSFGQFLDFVPARASKGQALRYIAQQWHVPLEHMLVIGGSGADEDMLRGNTLGVVLANRHREELSLLVETEQVYFAEQPYAWGILEAIEHYNFFNL